LATPAELLSNKSLADIEELTGEDSEASHAFAQYQYSTDRLGCGVKKSIIAIPEPQIPYVLNSSTIQVIEGGVDFTNNRIRLGSINLAGTFNDKISRVRFFGGLVHNTEKDVCNANIVISSGDTAASVLLKLAIELTSQTKSSLKPLLANASFVKYRGVKADKAALLATATPTNWDFAYVTTDTDYFIYKNGKWLKTYIGAAASDEVIFFVQANSGAKFNNEHMALHFYDKNSNQVDVTQDITAYSAGITTLDIKIGGYHANTANRCVAGVGGLEAINATETVLDLLETRLSDIEKPYICWNEDVTFYKDILVPMIKKRYNPTTNAQIGKDLAGFFVFPAIMPVSGVDAMDDVFFDSTGEIRTGWENEAQIQIVHFSTHAHANAHSDALLGAPLYVGGIANQGGSIINFLIERVAGYIASIQDSFTNGNDVFLYTKDGHIQNISTNDRYIKASFINAVRSAANLPFYEQLKSNKRSTNPYSTDIIDGNPDKYPFCFTEYIEENGFEGYVVSSARSLAKKASALRKSHVNYIKQYFGWLVSLALKPVITNSSQGGRKRLEIETAIKKLLTNLSTNAAQDIPSANQVPVLQEDMLQETIKKLVVDPRVQNGKNIYDIKCVIYPTGELEGVEVQIINLSN
jgi:hypothetical protein